MSKLEINQIKKCLLEGSTFVPVIVTEVGRTHSRCKIIEREWSGMKVPNSNLIDLHGVMLEECQKYVERNYKY